MLRVVSAALRGVAARATAGTVTNTLVPRFSFANLVQQRCFGALSSFARNQPAYGVAQNKPLFRYALSADVYPSISQPTLTPVRTIIKYSMGKGKRVTEKEVIKRFYRLNWGIWIRTKAGRKRRLWTKSGARRRRLRQHVFCNSTQSWMLDKMVTKYWRRPHYYVDDPYAPYHKREEFPYTRTKPFT